MNIDIGRPAERAWTAGDPALDLRHPPIVLRASEEAKLYTAALTRLLLSPRSAGPLLDELDRAQVLPDAEVGDEVAGLGSIVEYSEAGDRRVVELAPPERADPRRGRVSVLSALGAALLGLSPGQSILWCDRAGPRRRLQVHAVTPGAAAPGGWRSRAGPRPL